MFSPLTILTAKPPFANTKALYFKTKAVPFSIAAAIEFS